MTPHQALSDETREIAASFVLGEMEPSEAAGYRTHLAGCRVCFDEVESLRRAGDELVFAAPQMDPPPDLEDRLLKRIRATRAETVVYGAEAEWEPTGIEGVSVRTLFVDASRSSRTVLLRLAAGSVLPHHGHQGVEECYVVEGDVRDGDLSMCAGDFSRFEPDTEHGPLSSREGCVLLITTTAA